MNRVVSNFDQGTLDKIHDSSLELLGETCIRFLNEEAHEIFKYHGFRTEGEMVFFQETDIEKTLETVPEKFELHARNEKNSFVIGDDSYRMAPGYGQPFIIEPSGEMRQAVMEDTNKFCKLVQTSKALDFNSSILAQPNDVPVETAHLDVLLSTMLLTDKPLMGSTSSKRCAKESLEMADIIWGNTEKPVMINIVNSLSPLQYAEEMIDAILVYARARQPLIVHSSCSLGTSGPITIAGSLVISNACTLAGICLSQLVNPGTPIVYGLGGSPTDMRTGGYVNASPEDVKHTAIVTALGRYYHIPCRSQGALTESFCLDYQAGMESSMMLSTAALSGAHVSLHACGTYGSMLAMSFEKFLADEDLCCAIKTLIKPIEFSEDAFAMDLIKKLGTSATYLLEPHTASRCRSEYFIPDLNIRTIHSKWLEMDPRPMDQRASQLLEKRLSDYKKPEIDPSIENDLIKYLEMKKK